MQGFGNGRAEADRKRDDYLDFCRALFMFLGIVLHAALPFSAEHWLIEAPAKSALFSVLYDIIHSFRMPGFFLISGYFTYLTLSRRSPVDWLRQRSERLGIPLLFGIGFIVPFQSFAVDLGPHLMQSRFGMEDYVFSSLRDHARLDFQLISHLWFLLDLLIFSLAAALLAAWSRSVEIGRAADAYSRRLREAPVLVGGISLLALALYAGTAVFIAGETLGHGRLSLFSDTYFWGVIDVHRLLYHAPYFALGAALARDRELRDWFLRPSRLSSCAAFVTLAVLLTNEMDGAEARFLSWALSSVTGILVTRVILQAAKGFFDTPSRWLRLAVESSYTVYLVHQPILLFAVTAAIAMHLGAFSGFAFVLVATSIGSAAMHFATRGSIIARYALNGVRRAPARG